MKNVFLFLLAVTFAAPSAAQTGVLCFDESSRQTGNYSTSLWWSPSYTGWGGSFPPAIMCLAYEQGGECAAYLDQSAPPAGWLRVTNFSYAEELRVWPDHGGPAVVAPQDTIWLELDALRSIEHATFNGCPEG